MELSNTWVNIDLDAIAANYLAVQKKAEGAQVCAVVKADAYGHGAVAVAKHLQTVGADFFAVSGIFLLFLLTYSAKCCMIVLEQ